MQLDPELESVLSRLNDVLVESGYEFVIIGALVPSILIDLKSGNTGS